MTFASSGSDYHSLVPMGKSSSGRKRMRRLKSREDLISDLPDDVIGHILSCLSTKNAVKTSVLSRHWQYKWTLIYTIDVHSRDYNTGGYDDAKFLRFVDRVFSMTHNATIRTFYFICESIKCSDQLMTWIDTLRNVQELVIDTPNINSIVLPRSFSNCSSLNDLHVSSFKGVIEFPINTCFSNLEKLYIGYECGIRAKILNGSPNTRGRLSLNFPVLKVLDLLGCEWLDVEYVEILAPALNRFTTHGLPKVRNYKIKISAANLVRFESSHGSIDDFVLNTPGVTCAALCDHSLETNKPLFRAYCTLKAFPNLKFLKISGGVVKALLRLSSGLVFRKLDQLKELELCYSCSIKDILELLHKLPPLEILKLDMCNWDDYKEEEPLPLGIISCLKEITFVSFRGTKGQFDFAKFVVENAKNLRRVSVSVSPQPAVPGIGNKLRKLKPKGSSWELLFTSYWLRQNFRISY